MPTATCWWCASSVARDGRSVRLRHRRSGRIERVALCAACVREEDRSWRLAWERADDAP